MGTTKEQLKAIDCANTIHNVDLEKEYESFVTSDPVYRKLMNGIVGKAIARHFYDLGRSNRQQELMQTMTAKQAWKDMRLEVYAQASGNRQEPNISDDTSKIFSLTDIDEIFEKIGDMIVEQGVTMEISNETKWDEVDSFIHKNLGEGMLIQIRKK